MEIVCTLFHEVLKIAKTIVTFSNKIASFVLHAISVDYCY